MEIGTIQQPHLVAATCDVLVSVSIYIYICNVFVYYTNVWAN